MIMEVKTKHLVEHLVLKKKKNVLKDISSYDFSSSPSLIGKGSELHISVNQGQLIHPGSGSKFNLSSGRGSLSLYA